MTRKKKESVRLSFVQFWSKMKSPSFYSIWETYIAVLSSTWELDSEGVSAFLITKSRNFLANGFEKDFDIFSALRIYDWHSPGWHGFLIWYAPNSAILVSQAFMAFLPFCLSFCQRSFFEEGYSQFFPMLQNRVMSDDKPFFPLGMYWK